IYSVCSDCNSKLGSRVDSKLVNHTFMEFARYRHKIRGKKGGLSNPFAGVGVLSDDPEQKIRTEMDDDGNFVTRLLPKIPKLESGSTHIQFSIDAADRHLKDTVIDKILKRNGIDRSQVNFYEETERSERPEIHQMMLFDISDFKIGLLKIAYEFTIDTLPAYFEDEVGKIIADILHRGDLQAMKGKVQFFGNGFTKKILKPLEHLVDFENDNHYLVLIEAKALGLICQVNLFNSISIAIQMSTKQGYLDRNIIVGINDIRKCTFEKLDICELVKRTYSSNEYAFQFWFATKDQLSDFEAFQSNTEYEYYYENDRIPFYDRWGRIRYTSINDKLLQPNLSHVAEGDDVNEIITKIELDEELFVMLSPGMRFVQVAAVRIIQRRIGKV
ncbi:MAG: hypothetical protein J7502_09830, partial [Flavisolibacter sp.]|nr:hypothetical protein [Flavisolibacter sp.]